MWMFSILWSLRMNNLLHVSAMQRPTDSCSILTAVPLKVRISSPEHLIDCTTLFGYSWVNERHNIRQDLFSCFSFPDRGALFISMQQPPHLLRKGMSHTLMCIHTCATDFSCQLFFSRGTVSVMSGNSAITDTWFLPDTNRHSAEGKLRKIYLGPPKKLKIHSW